MYKYVQRVIQENSDVIDAVDATKDKIGVSGFRGVTSDVALEHDMPMKPIGLPHGN